MHEQRSGKCVRGASRRNQSVAPRGRRLNRRTAGRTQLQADTGGDGRTAGRNRTQPRNAADSQGHESRGRAGCRTGERERSRHHRSEEHTSELQSLVRISYAVFCLKKKKQPPITNPRHLVQSSTLAKHIHTSYYSRYLTEHIKTQYDI